MIRWSSSIVLGASAGVAACLALYWYYYRRSSKTQRSGSGGVPVGRLVQPVSGYTTEVHVPDEAVGYVIGRDGQNLKQIRSQMGVRVSFKQTEGGSQVAVISGKRDSVDQAKSMIQRQVKEKLTVKKVETFAMQIPQYSVGRIIGKQGRVIRELCRLSGARITVERGREYDLLSMRACTITGTAEQIGSAKTLLEEKVAEENEFRRKRGSEQGMHRKTTRETPSVREDGGMPVPVAKAMTVDLAALAPRLPATDDYFTVYVSAVEFPGHFWVQALEPNGTNLDSMSREMNGIYPLLGAGELAVTDVAVGDIVCAMFDYDSSWYRARIEEVVSDSELEVYFVDFGDNSRVSYDSIRKLRPEFLQLPFQAVECGLHGVKPKGVESIEWSDEAIDRFEHISHCAKWIPLMARVIGFESDQSTRDVVPMLELIDTNSQEDINVAGELVKGEFAVWSSDEQMGGRAENGIVVPSRGTEPDVIVDSLTKDA